MKQRRKTIKRPGYITGNAKTYSFKAGCPPDCKCDAYCQQRADAEHLRRMCYDVQKAAEVMDTVDGAYLLEPLRLQFCGLEVVVRSNTNRLVAEINDTSGA